MKTYIVRMNYTRAYFAEVQANSESEAEDIARFNMTPNDCEADDYAEWEVYSTQAQEQTA